MFPRSLINKFFSFKRCSYAVPQFLNRRHVSNVTDKNAKTTADKSTSLGEIGSKYQIFRDQDSEIILDVYEERLKYHDLLEKQEEVEDEFAGLNLERGKTGVFEIEDLVQVLKAENVENIFVAAVPKEINYVQYICVVNGKSVKHMQAIAQFVRRVYKQKRHKSDIIPKLEGANSKDWLALDLGNIALHIFSRSARQIYDLESLWSVGPKFDDEFNKQDPISIMLEKHSIYLSDLEPAS